MPTYLYFCQEEHGEFECEHSIKDKIEFCPQCEAEGKKVEVKRLIHGGTGFILTGGGWAKEGYSG